MKSVDVVKFIYKENEGSTCEDVELVFKKDGRSEIVFESNDGTIYFTTKTIPIVIYMLYNFDGFCECIRKRCEDIMAKRRDYCTTFTNLGLQVDGCFESTKKLWIKTQDCGFSTNYILINEMKRFCGREVALDVLKKNISACGFLYDVKEAIQIEKILDKNITSIVEEGRDMFEKLLNTIK